MWRLEDPTITGKPKKKFICPNCGKKRLTRYINADLEYADSDHGYCDRVHSCGYHSRPNGSSAGKVISIAPKPKRQFINWDEVDIEFNPDAPLTAYLSTLYGAERVHEAYARYHLGTDPQRPKYAVFTYIDDALRLNRIKRQAYGHDGHRLKGPGSTYTPKKYTVADGYFQVLFGLHLYDPQKITCIVESEKTALMAAIEYPEYIWMATGSMQNTALIKQVQQAVLYPDKGKAFEYWANKLNQSKYPCDPFLENIPELKEGDDLADLFELQK